MNGVIAGAATVGGREVTRLELEPSRRTGTLGVDFGDQPTFVVLPDAFEDGVIEVELCAKLLPDAPDYARGFIGLAYRITEDMDRFESVYLRPTNGLFHAPPPPRDRRAVQYYAYPDWTFEKLRRDEPDGPYEAPADIRLGDWMTLRLDIFGHRHRASVNGVQVLDLAQGKLPPVEGRVGLWVDIGTEGFFRNLTIRPASLRDQPEGQMP